MYAIILIIKVLLKRKYCIVFLVEAQNGLTVAYAFYKFSLTVQQFWGSVVFFAFFFAFFFFAFSHSSTHSSSIGSCFFSSTSSLSSQSSQNRDEKSSLGLIVSQTHSESLKRSRELVSSEHSIGKRWINHVWIPGSPLFEMAKQFCGECVSRTFICYCFALEIRRIRGKKSKSDVMNDIDHQFSLQRLYC